MWYLIKNLWSVWFTEWHANDIPLDELIDIIDI